MKMKVALFCCLIGLILSNSSKSKAAAYPDAVNADGPIVYFRFSDVPPVATNSGSLGVAVNGTYNGAAAPGGEAPRSPDFFGFESDNTALQLDGSSAFVSTVSGLLNDHPVFTISGWIRRAADQLDRTGIWGQNDLVEFGYINNNTLEVWTDNGLDLDNSFANSQWSYLALVSDGSPGTMKMYTNGYLAGSRSHTLPDTNSFAFNIGGGGIFDVAGNFFNGQIDEVAIFDKALTDEQIAHHYYSGVHVAPVIVSEPPLSTNIFEGATLQLIMVARGSPTLSYQWTKFFTPIDGQTNATLIVSNASVNDSDSYILIVTNEFGTATSDTIEVTVSATQVPTITQEPASITRYAGIPVTLAVAATGASQFKYQWQRGLADVPGATNALLVFTNLQPANAGDYRAIVSDSVGSATSMVATVTVLVPAPGSYVESIVSLGPLAYWRFNETNGTTAFDYYGGHDATYMATAAPGAEAPRSPQFPGFEADNQAVQLDGSSGFVNGPVGFMNNLSSFTMLGWIRRGADQANRTGIFGQNDIVEFGYINNNTLELWTDNGLDVSPNPFPNSEWDHVAVSADGSPGTARMYTNGVLAGFRAQVLPDPNNFAFNIGGGGVFDATGNFFNGQIDEVAVFDKALTSEQICSVYLKATGQKVSLAITLGGNIILDSKPVGTKHDGADFGAAWVESSSDSINFITRTGLVEFAAADLDQITLAPDPDFNSSQGTIMFWMRSAGTTGNGNFGAMLVDRRSNRGDVIVQGDDGTIFVQANGGNGTVNSFSTGAVSDNGWHHIAYVYDQAGATTIYIDGLQTMSQVTSAPWSWDPGQQIELGRSHDTYWRAFNGQMDDFRIYNRILTGDEIAQVVSSDALVDTAALKVRFNFDAPPIGLTMRWLCGTLQCTDTLVGNGPGTGWTDVVNAASPYVVNPQAAAHRFYRVKY